MKQIIPFEKSIVFKSDVANITSISLDHEEKVSNGEVNGEFIIYGDYKVHNDTTEVETFKYKLPYTTIIPDNIDSDTVSIKINDFTYDIFDKDVLKVYIEYIIDGVEREEVEVLEDKELDEVLSDVKEDREEVKEEIPKEEELPKKVDDDYVMYHIHIVEKEETLESIIKKYDICLDDLKEYNDVSKLSVGDKLIIPYHE